MRTFFLHLAFLSTLALAEPITIDWERAKALHQRVSRGETLSAEDRKYYEEALRQRGGASAEDSPEMRRAKDIHRRKQAGETITPEEEKVLAEALRRRGDRTSRDEKRAAPPAPPEGLAPLTDKTAAYKGQDGGLFGGGSNEPPAELAARAAKAAQEIQPLGPDGKPASDGKIVLLSIGMSNTTQEFSAFKRLAEADSRKAANVVVVDGAQGGKDARNWSRAAMEPWNVAGQRLAAAGATPQQVQALWIKQAIAGPRDGWPAATNTLRDLLADIVRVAREKYPNARLVFLSSRTYAGYATTSLNPEPYAYESAFAVRDLIRQQASDGPALLWGPYLWADGAKPRTGDGFHYVREDFGPDGTHPSDSGRQKVAQLLLGFFTSNHYAKSWFTNR